MGRGVLNKCPQCHTEGSLELQVDTHDNETYVFTFKDNLEAIRDPKKEDKIDFCDKDRIVVCNECLMDERNSRKLFEIRALIREKNPGLI